MTYVGHHKASLAPGKVLKDTFIVRGRGMIILRRCPTQYNHVVCSCLINGTISMVLYATGISSCHITDTKPLATLHCSCFSKAKSFHLMEVSTEGRLRAL